MPEKWHITAYFGILQHITAFYSIKWHPMMTASIEHKHKCALVPYLHYLARAAGSEQVSPNIMVKNVIFMGFYGILRHFLVNFPTEFFVFSMDACVYMYIAPLNRRLCCGIFSYLPQLKRGVANTYKLRAWHKQLNFPDSLLYLFRRHDWIGRNIWNQKNDQQT